MRVTLFLLLLHVVDGLRYKISGSIISARGIISASATTGSQPESEGKRAVRTARELFVVASRASLVLSSLGGGSLVAYGQTASASQQPPAAPLRGFQTKSGLRYFDLVEGSLGESPRYGDLVSFYYSCYYRPPGDNSALEFIDSNPLPFLHKHGNGRVIRGIDEALHTMKVGGKRRIIVPKSIGYNEFGLGPLPEDGSRRRRLGALLDLLDKDQGELIFDLELALVAEDENDQGYYDDEAVSQDEVRKLVIKSLQANSQENLDKLKAETPPNLFKK